ncbi:MAG: hypothetical protein MUO22_04780, partial [Sedimentisphaerales bacterium]|nr:hypothetical protein [Sedimentisphaerales bacterium]
ERKKMKVRRIKGKWFLLICVVFLIGGGGEVFSETPVKEAVLNAEKQFQVIDGFGANINPAQWRDGELKAAIDLLVDELGCSLFRFDCYGQANWLDPGKRDEEGCYAEAYLEEVYTSKVFRDAWETYRYMQSKGVKLFLNVSGRIPAGLAGPDGERLIDYDGYAEMVVSLLKWARYRENLEFTLFAPYNETDLGRQEGPRLFLSDCLPVTKAIVAKMKAAGLGDVKLMVMDDSGVHLDKLEEFMNDAELVESIGCFAIHTYGNGLYADGGDSWYLNPSGFSRMIERISKSPYKDCPVWMTEYGDLDQTEEIEFGIAWRSTRRLLRFLNDGVSAGLVWDAFDNYHKHDESWSIYGLLRTDRESWEYTPKRRFYSAKQVFRYVKPGFKRVEVSALNEDRDNIYYYATNPLRHVLMSGFVSSDKGDFTVVGMSTIEHDVFVDMKVQGLSPAAESKTIFYYRTSRDEDCRKIEEIQIKDGSVKVLVKEGSIFTLTTVE